jgi:hypothetical protein
VSEALVALGFETLPPENPKVMDAPVRLKVTDAALKALKNAKMIEVESDGTVTVK